MEWQASDILERLLRGKNINHVLMQASERVEDANGRDRGGKSRPGPGVIEWMEALAFRSPLDHGPALEPTQVYDALDVVAVCEFWMRARVEGPPFSFHSPSGP